MSLVDHLSELRTRIFRALIAVAIGSVIGFLFAERIIDILSSPCRPARSRSSGLATASSSTSRSRS